MEERNAEVRKGERESKREGPREARRRKGTKVGR